MSNSDSSSKPIDKDYLWGRYQRKEDRATRFTERLAHKAADIPYDDPMHFEANRHGLDWKGLAVIVTGLLGLGGLATTLIAGLAGAGIWMYRASQPTQQVEVKPVQSDFTVEFFDQNGNRIDVPHISEMPK